MGANSAQNPPSLLVERLWAHGPCPSHLSSPFERSLWVPLLLQATDQLSTHSNSLSSQESIWIMVRHDPAHLAAGAARIPTPTLYHCPSQRLPFQLGCTTNSVHACCLFCLGNIMCSGCSWLWSVISLPWEAREALGCYSCLTVIRASLRCCPPQQPQLLEPCLGTFSNCL